MRIEQTSTGVIIHQPTDEVKRKCLRYFSLRDPLREYFIYSGKDTSKKPLFGKEHDVIYITSGFLHLEDKAIRVLQKQAHHIHPKDGKTVHVTMNRQPRSKLQEDCIRNIVNSKSSKITIEVKPGVELTGTRVWRHACKIPN